MSDIQDAELEQRVRGYFTEMYGDRVGSDWEQINALLEAGDKSLAEGLVSTPVTMAEAHPSADGGQSSNGHAARQQKRRLFSWPLAAAATIVLALGGLAFALSSVDLGGIFRTKERVVYFEGFETGLQGWDLQGNQLASYKDGIDNSTFHSGGASVFIEATSNAPLDTAWLGKSIKPDDTLLNKRIRFSAYIKSDSEGTAANLYMGVYGQTVKINYPSRPEGPRLLGLDSTTDRFVRGKVDWERIDVVLDVPADAKGIYIALMVSGNGRVWFDDVQFSVADGSVPVTNSLQNTEPANPGFEQGLSAWGASNRAFLTYELTIDSETRHEGTSSAVISSTVTTAEPNAGPCMCLEQLFLTENVRGKRVRLSAWMKTEAVEGRAVLWLGMRDIANTPSNWGDQGSAHQEVSGTSDWARYDVVLDVPQDSLYFLLITGLEGKGKMWIDDVRLEVVGNDVPTTRWK